MFIDNSGNLVEHVATHHVGNGRSVREMDCICEDNHGYLTDGEWSFPGPVLCWFGQGERYANVTIALEALANMPDAQYR